VYENTWINRCYENGIPDTTPSALMSKRLAPSWNSIALALLKNDLNLISLGFAPPSSKLEIQLVLKRKKEKSTQLELRI